MMMHGSASAQKHQVLTPVSSESWWALPAVFPRGSTNLPLPAPLLHPGSFCPGSHLSITQCLALMAPHGCSGSAQGITRNAVLVHGSLVGWTGQAVAFSASHPAVLLEGTESRPSINHALSAVLPPSARLWYRP